MENRVVKTRMLTFRCAKRSNKHFPTSLKSLLNNHRGFSLIEILVALLIVVAVLSITGIGTNPVREKLDDSIYLVERAVRFCNDESILRNAVTRINFLLDEDPQQLAVEYGPNSDFIIPISMTEGEDNFESMSEKEASDKSMSRFDNQFHKVKEFQEENKEIADGIKIIGIGTTMNKRILKEGSAGLYVYPNGEKDGGIVVFASYDEIATISFEPFNLEFRIDYIPITQEFLDEDERLDFLQNKADEIIKEWQKNEN